MENETIISLENVSVFQAENIIISDVNLSVQKGEFLYLIGKVGSGKSSLLKTLYAELSLTHGTGVIAGFSLNKIRKSQIPLLRRKLGIIFQDFQLLTDRNIYENLLFVLKATGWKNKVDIQNRINLVLEKVNLLEKKSKLPHQLSGGEQQRIVIARSLLNNPEVILADEPTGNLDPDSSDIIMKILIEIMKEGTTVIMATHNYTLIERFPFRTIKCEDTSLIDIN